MEVNNKLIASRFPIELVEELDAVAKFEDKTRSQLLRKITRKYISTVKKGKTTEEFYGIDPFFVR